MKTIGNVLWFIFVGIWSAIGWMVIAAVLFCLVVTIPFARQCVKMARLSMWPIGRTTIPDPTAPNFGAVGQVVWVVLAGWWMAIGYFIGGAFMCITIIGIPFGIQSFKLGVLSFAPFGRRIVTTHELAHGHGAHVPAG